MSVFIIPPPNLHNLCKNPRNHLADHLDLDSKIHAYIMHTLLYTDSRQPDRQTDRHIDTDIRRFAIFAIYFDTLGVRYMQFRNQSVLSMLMWIITKTF